jgi:hypothetical protein
MNAVEHALKGPITLDAPGRTLCRLGPFSACSISVDQYNQRNPRSRFTRVHRSSRNQILRNLTGCE